MAGAPRPKGWTCRACRHFNTSRRLLNCSSCGKRRKVRKSKHAELLDAARPQYEAMLAAQNGRCAICLSPPASSRRFDIDHDHRRLTIRGLLCPRCNRALHSWMTAEWLRAAADYLDHAAHASSVPKSLEGSGRVAAHASSVRSLLPETERAA